MKRRTRHSDGYVPCLNQIGQDAAECCSAPRPKRSAPPDLRSAESSVWISDAADWYSRAICRKRARPAVVVALRANSKQRAAQSSNCFKVALILSVKMLMR